ncbi:hypothetical protein B0H14DRAFT_2910651 [Mycena olivaceomarginata]|nr:hypothetical protein B0H14DRAFT_2910651 [Mycena olivaceomarginata]
MHLFSVGLNMCSFRLSPFPLISKGLLMLFTSLSIISLQLIRLLPGILTRMSNRVIEICLIGGEHNGKTAFIPRISITPSAEQIAFEMKRHQFPVRLAFCMTINKAQGQSVHHVGLDLCTNVFAHGQLHVPLSQCTSSQRIKALFKTDVSTVTKNIVYPEVLLV